MAKKRFVSMRAKIMAFSVILTVCPILIVSGFSYFEAGKVVRNQAIELNLANAKQISNTLDMIINEVNTISLNLIQNNEVIAYLSAPDSDTRQQNYARILSIMNEQVFNKNYIYSIYIQDLSETGIDNRGAVNLVPGDRLIRAKDLRGRASWYFDTVFVQGKEVNVISMIRDIRDIYHIERSLGILKINLLESSIRELYRTKAQDQSLFYLIDRDRVVLSALSDDEIGRKIGTFPVPSDLDSRSEGTFNTSVDGRNYLGVFYRMEARDWYIIELTPYERISQPGNVIKQVTFYSIAASLAVCFGFILFFGYRVLEPLKQLRILMKHVEREQFQEMKVRGNDEIALLTRSFNRMSQRLNELINEVHVSRIKQKEAELKALEEQINPHFLYNTLDLIYWMSRMEKAFETASMVSALSRLFRIGLNRGSRFTKVGKEIEHIHYYIQIQQKRYEELIVFSISIEQETMDCKVTKMVLQPVVENAIRHGIEPKGTNGRIDIRVFRDGDDLVYQVSDNGVGADAAAIQEVLDQPATDQRGLGLKNIHDRLKLNYGARYGVTFESVPGEGTTVTIRQPYVKGSVQDV